MTRKQVFSWFFIGIFLFLLFLFYQILEPFTLSLFWAAILALVLYPVYERLKRLLRGRAGISSVIMTVITILAVVIPLVAVFTTVAIELFDVYQVIRVKIQLVNFSAIVERARELIPVTIIEEAEKRFDLGEMRIDQIVLRSVGTASKYVFDQLQQGAKNLTSLLFNFFIMTFALFFFFRDGRKLYEQIKFLIPMKEEQKTRIFDRFNDILNAVVVGIAATACIQGIAMGALFWLLGLSFAVLAGVLTALFSLLPFGGSLFVWLPVGVYLLAAGDYITGIIVLVIGGGVVGSIDNVLKPWIISGRVELPTLFLFLSILGSVSAFGFSGIILGPVALVIFLSFIEIYKVEYRIGRRN
ncbi:MAG: AI-2E family transporter [Deltaproteobacteria bacterium]